MRKLKVGVIGLGLRGHGLMKTILKGIDEIDIIAVSDVYQDRVDDAIKQVQDANGTTPFGTTDYKELLALKDVEAVIVATSWETHVSVSIDAMRAGKATGMEVGGAYNLEELWELVDVYEETKTPFMFLENCCYGEFELMVTNIVRQGDFGDVLYCSGAYSHDLREEIAGGIDTHHYRLAEYTNFNCENYPTHELGPIAKLLNITSGNRFTKVVSMASKSIGLKHYIANNPKYKDRLGHVDFKQGDVVTTMIECENGETIFLKLDTTLPRLYERGLTASGTKGFYNQTTQSVILDGKIDHEHTAYKDVFFNAKDYNDYLPDDWKNITPDQIKAGHGGMDFVMLKHFIDCIKNKKPMPIDVYDAVTWMCITALSEESIAKGSIPVECPDFTRGKYKTRKTVDTLPFPVIKQDQCIWVKLGAKRQFQP